MAQWQFVDWLLFWLLETKKFHFEWDDGNRTKNKEKHNVTVVESESVFQLGRALPLGIQVNSSSMIKEQRLGIVGVSISGRVLQIAFVLRNKNVRIISARPANKKERIQYEESIRKILKDI